MHDKRGLDEPTDELGYHGKSRWARVKVVGEITECLPLEFGQIVAQDSLKLHKVTNTIRQIDIDRNGYVTRNELDDILKMCFTELVHKNLDKLYNPFASIQNNILIDHKRFVDWIKKIQSEALKNKEVLSQRSKVLSEKMSQMIQQEERRKTKSIVQDTNYQENLLSEKHLE